MQTKILPYESQLLPDSDDWRKDFFWPVNYLDTRMNYIHVSILIHEFIGSLNDPLLKNTMFMVMHRIVPLAIWKMEALHTHIGARSHNIQLAHITPEFDYLFGTDSDTSNHELARKLASDTDPKISSLRLFLQRVKWSYKWSGAFEAGRSFYNSDNKVISTGGPFLTREMQNRGFKPAFHLGSLILKSARKKYRGNFSLPDDWRGEIERLIGLFAEASPFEGEDKQRYFNSLLIDMLTMIPLCAQDLLALQQVKRLPKTVWSGTGSKHSVRAVGLEVMRRGGEAVRFAHGGTHGLVRSFGQVAGLELAVSTEFVAFSKMQRDLILTSGEMDLSNFYNPGVNISSGVGEPNIANFANAIPKRNKNSKIKVVYILGTLGWFVAKPAAKILNNVLYMDFTYHVMETLNEMPFDAVCKPHPGGLLPGARHPLSDPKVPGNTPFELVVADADVVVADHPFSQALWQMMGTDRGVVYIDTGISEFHPEIIDKVRERCRFIKAHIDDRGRFRVDPEEFQDAIAEAAKQKPDTSFFETVHA